MERRRSTRVGFNLTVEIRYGDIEYEAELLNVSLTGMLLQSDIPLQIGGDLEVILSLGDEDFEGIRLQLKAQVVREADDDQYGLEFKELSLDSFIHLKNIVTYNTGDPRLVQWEMERIFANAPADKSPRDAKG